MSVIQSDPDGNEPGMQGLRMGGQGAVVIEAIDKPQTVDRATVRERLERVVALPLVSMILRRLRDELSPKLVYHSYAHTTDVMSEAICFALEDGISDREVTLLGVAAAFHDSGFLIDSADHERHSAEIFTEMIERSAHSERIGPASGEDYSEAERTLIHQMILDTKLRTDGDGPVQRPSSNLSAYLLDADLSNLGRDDFRLSVTLVREELARFGVTADIDPGELLRRHVWHTNAARRLRERKKQENLATLSG